MKAENNLNRFNFTRNTSITLYALGISGVGSVIFNSVIARRWGQGMLGQVGSLEAAATWVGLLATSGLGAATSRYVAESASLESSKERTRSVWTSLLLALGLVVILIPGIFILGVLISGTNGQPPYPMFPAWALATAYSLYTYFKGLYYGQGRVGLYAIAESLAFIVVLFGLLLMPFAIGSSDLIIVFSVGYSILPVVGFLIVVPWGNQIGIRLADLSRITRYAVVTSIGTAASMGLQYLGIPLTNAIQSNAEAGGYAAALTLLRPTYLIPRALNLVMVPTMAFFWGKGETGSIRLYISTTTKYLVGIMLLMCGVLFLAAEPILILVFGSEFKQASSTLTVLLIGAFTTVVSVPAVSGMMTTEEKWIKTPMLASIAGAFVAGGFWILLIPKYGMLGTAIGFAIGSCIKSGIPLYISSRVLKWAPADSGKIFVSGALLLFSAHFLRELEVIENSVWLASLFVVSFLLINKHELWGLLSMIRNQIPVWRNDG